MIHLKLKDHEYDVVVETGARKKAGKLIRQIWQPRKVAIISDDNVAPIYLSELKSQLQNEGFKCFELIVKSGESAKSLSNLKFLLKQMAANSFTRDDAVIALGGGVVGDLSGLTASLYMRGIAYLQIATSFTAQVDSSVGGKTAIDLAGIKNIMGTFYQPDLVIVDPQYLETLETRDLVEGYAEVVKTSALAGSDFFELTGSINSVDDLRKNALELAERSIAYKAKIVMADEKEGGVRKFLNFGHTFGHPIEAINAGKMRHGEAVSIGMVAITRCFERDHISPQGLTNQLIRRLTQVGLPISSPFLGTDNFFKLLQNDKKNRSGILNLVAIKKIGEPIIVLKKLAEVPYFMRV